MKKTIEPDKAANGERMAGTEAVENLADQPVDNFAENSDSTSVEPVENSSAEVVENLDSGPVENSENATSESFDAGSADLDDDSIKDKAKIAELVQDLQRTRADFENFRKQTELQKSQAMAAARFATVEKFLPLVDDFSRAISAYPEQLAPLEKNLDKLMKDLGLEVIKSAPGTEFNPDYHEAISVEDGEGDTEVIAETLRPGYLYDGAVLRAAMVKVTHK